MADDLLFKMKIVIELNAYVVKWIVGIDCDGQGTGLAYSYGHHDTKQQQNSHDRCCSKMLLRRSKPFALS